MSLARAVTKRMKRSEAPNVTTPARSQSVKSPGLPIDRTKISGPVALVSTTNMLSYNAPDIASLKMKTSSTTNDSADDSDHSISQRSRSSSHGSTDSQTDASSVDESPTSPKPNHLSGYFAAANPTVRKSTSSSKIRESLSSTNLGSTQDKTEDAAPAIPERALSHSKRAHEKLAQKRSVQNMTSRQNSVRSTHSAPRTSTDLFTAPIAEETHPFGPELEQLNEVAEELSGVVRDAEYVADCATLREGNLGSFCATDYLAELQPLMDARFSYVGRLHYPAPLAWI